MPSIVPSTGDSQSPDRLTEAERTALLHANCILEEHDDGSHGSPDHCAYLADPPFAVVERIIAARTGAAELAASQWRLRFTGVVQRLEETVSRTRVLETELAEEERDHERALSLMESALEERDHHWNAAIGLAAEVQNAKAERDVILERAAATLDDLALTLMATSEDNPTGNALTAAIVQKCAAIVREVTV